ncbi:unnamed protein product [Rotaria sp. Silwood1]|nr:unnamed protein product [Rotaria sp. Silwood1]CAF0965661.1 unnamed protein product [Rotaria sp. Silwood1]CAF0974895.1 unnamed protein product [Rotaria sp. Silwood1]CAF3391850.1 unnamed protein product [Rotaria sp. Silwood1]CAF3408523.1 unnamed protein product [Rotaria sp. Silwood1]
MPRTTSANHSNGHSGPATTKSTKKVTIKNGSGIPTIEERLGYLRPSRELLEFYRRKIAQYDNERDDILQKLDRYKVAYEEKHKLEWELRKRESEIVELQKAISDLQIYLFQEREQVLRLYAENDRLKIQELQDRKKINRLLNLCGVTEEEITYFIKEPPGVGIVPQKVSPIVVNEQRSSSSYKKDLVEQKSSNISSQIRDNETLSLQIEALQAQLEEQTKLAKEQIESLLEDRRVRIEEYDVQRKRDEERLKQAQEKIVQMQNLLHESTKDVIESKFDLRNAEKQWLHEKDQLLQELDKTAAHEQRKDDEILFLNASNHIQNTSSAASILLQENAYFEEERKKYEDEIHALEQQHVQTHKLAEMYRNQVLALEEQLCKIREEGDVTREIYKDRSEKMGQRLTLSNERFKELERRRNMEIEGFKTDIKMLRQKLKYVEKQLFRVTVGLTGNSDEIDVLQHVKETAVRSKEMQGELNHLKAKIYNLENDVRHL